MRGAVENNFVAHPPPSASSNGNDVKQRPRSMSGHHHGQRVTKRPVEFKFDMITTPSPPQANQYSQFQRGGRSQQQQQYQRHTTTYGRKLVDPSANTGGGYRAATDRAASVYLGTHAYQQHGSSEKQHVRSGSVPVSPYMQRLASGGGTAMHPSSSSTTTRKSLSARAASSSSSGNSSAAAAASTASSNGGGSSRVKQYGGWTLERHIDTTTAAAARKHHLLHYQQGAPAPAPHAPAAPKSKTAAAPVSSLSGEVQRQRPRTAVSAHRRARISSSSTTQLSMNHATNPSTSTTGDKSAGEAGGRSEVHEPRPPPREEAARLASNAIDSANDETRYSSGPTHVWKSSTNAYTNRTRDFLTQRRVITSAT